MKKQKTDKQVEDTEGLKNQLARVLADYDNLKKRSEEERSSMYKLASIAFMTRLLPIIDNLQEAQKHINDSGLAIIIGQLETLAKDEGFSELKLHPGDNFNANDAEAIEAIETEDKMKDNKISEVSLSGWKYTDGTVVRHARVKVLKFKGKTNLTEEKVEMEEKINE